VSTGNATVQMMKGLAMTLTYRVPQIRVSLKHFYQITCLYLLSPFCPLLARALVLCLSLTTWFLSASHVRLLDAGVRGLEVCQFLLKSRDVWSKYCSARSGCVHDQKELILIWIYNVGKCRKFFCFFVFRTLVFFTYPFTFRFSVAKRLPR
jgi:hypothetical protein